jgi:hypothetical protein
MDRQLERILTRVLILGPRLIILALIALLVAVWLYKR